MQDRFKCVKFSSFPIISSHFQSFPVISSHFQSFPVIHSHVIFSHFLSKNFQSFPLETRNCKNFNFARLVRKKKNCRCIPTFFFIVQDQQTRTNAISTTTAQVLTTAHTPPQNQINSYFLQTNTSSLRRQANSEEG